MPKFYDPVWESELKRVPQAQSKISNPTSGNAVLYWPYSSYLGGRVAISNAANPYTYQYTVTIERTPAYVVFVAAAEERTSNSFEDFYIKFIRDNVVIAQVASLDSAAWRMILGYTYVYQENQTGTHTYEIRIELYDSAGNLVSAEFFIPTIGIIVIQ